MHQLRPPRDPERYNKKLSFDRRAYGASLEGLCSELVSRTAGSEGIDIITPLFHDGHGNTRVKLLRQGEKTVHNARLLAGMSIRKLFEDLRSKAPGLARPIPGLRFFDVELVTSKTGSRDLALVEGGEEKGVPAEHRGIFTREQTVIWETLQATADTLQAKRGEASQLLERDFSITPDFRIAEIGPFVPDSAIEEVGAIIVGHGPISVDFMAAIPAPYGES